MQNNLTTFATNGADEAAKLVDKVSDSVTQVTEKVSRLGTAAVHKIDEQREAAASGLKKAASAIHEGGDKLNSAAHSAADAVDSTADWVKEHNTSRIMSDVSTCIRNNPGPSLLAAAVVGFLVGRAFSGGSRSA